ncbi:MAG: autotransporter outer membrane beta-barrel domain-containing protein [Bacteroidetes bacterium]|nr:autotransporter outer membrane beta-barrel domain-containing protein [Bacteroidota bacterium]
MLKRIILIVVFPLMFASSLFAQDDFPAGSPYTIFGIGDLNYSTAIRTTGMGIQGISLTGNYINNMNSAALSKLPYTSFSMLFNYNFLKSSDGTRTVSSSNGNAFGLNIGVPLSQEQGWSLALGFNPYSNINYKIINNSVSLGETVKQTYAGRGGISRINIGMSYTLAKSISLGADYNYAFGDIKDLKLIEFTSSSGFTPTRIQSEYDYTGSYFKGGAIIDLEKLLKLKKSNDFTIGFLYESPLTLTAKLDGIVTSSISTDTVTVSKGDIKIPARIGFGITKKVGNRYLLSSDFMMQDWSSFTSNGVVQPNYQSAMRVGAGLEIQPIENSDNSWDKLSYRLGGFYEKSYYTVNGESINRIGLTAGLGVPISKYNSLDFAVSVSTRGKIENGLIKDDMIRLTAGINFGELWFVRPKDEDR